MVIINNKFKKSITVENSNILNNISSSHITRNNNLTDSSFKVNSGIINNIIETHEKINNCIQSLDQKIFDLLNYQEADFISSYKDKMYSIKKEFERLKDKINENKVKQKNDKKLNYITKERDFFRDKAMALFEDNKQLFEKYSKLKNDYNALKEDKIYFESYVLELKKYNHELKIELYNEKNNVLTSNNTQQEIKRITNKPHSNYSSSISKIIQKDNNRLLKIVNNNIDTNTITNKNKNVSIKLNQKNIKNINSIKVKNLELENEKEEFIQNIRDNQNLYYNLRKLADNDANLQILNKPTSAKTIKKYNNIIKKDNKLFYKLKH